MPTLENQVLQTLHDWTFNAAPTAPDRKNPPLWEAVPVSVLLAYMGVDPVELARVLKRLTLRGLVALHMGGPYGGGNWTAPDGRRFEAEFHVPASLYLEVDGGVSAAPAATLTPAGLAAAAKPAKPTKKTATRRRSGPRPLTELQQKAYTLVEVNRMPPAEAALELPPSKRTGKPITRQAVERLVNVARAKLAHKRSGGSVSAQALPKNK